jgi:hypothetical protein
MLARLERFWALIALLLILALFVMTVLRPDWSRPAAIVVVGLSAAAAIGFTIRRNVSIHRRQQTTYAQLARAVAVDLVGLTLVVSVASLLGGAAGAWASARIGFWGGLLTGMLVGFAAASAVAWGWRRLTAGQSETSSGGS